MSDVRVARPRLWVVWYRTNRGRSWYPAHWTLSFTRRESIAKYEEDGVPADQLYRSRRRRGEVKCVAVRIIPIEEPTQ